MMPIKPGMMMVMDQIDRQQRYPRSEYSSTPERRMIGYDRDYNIENRRRYAEGEGWQGNRMAYDGMEPESRRRRDSRGRYMMDDDDDDMRGQTWYPPHGNMPQMMAAPMGTTYPMGMHGGSRYGFGDVHADIYAPNAMNRPMGGMMGGDMSAPVDEHTARMWVGKMDGGEHFKMEQTDQMRAALCPDCNRYEFFVAMNAMYSDHCETAKKVNMDKPEFYAHLAKDFLKDTDAKPHKLRRYMEHIAK